MTQKTATRINFAFWAIVAVVIMICAYFAWSKYGDYTVVSFVASLVIHGGGCAFFGVVCNDAIVRYYHNKQ